MPSDIGDLLVIAEGLSLDGSDHSSVRRGIEASESSAIFLVDVRGDLLFAEGPDSERISEYVRETARELNERLGETAVCRFEFPIGCDDAVLLATRFSGCHETLIAGCVAPSLQFPGAEVDELVLAGAICAAFARSLQRCRASEAVLSKRIEHLQAEHLTLKNSHAHAISAAIEEREKRIEQQRQDVARLDAVMKLAADGIMTIDDRGTIESFNEAAGRIFGYEPEEVIGKNVSMLVPKASRARHERLLANCLRGEAPFIGVPRREVMGEQKDGTVFPLEIAVSRVALDDRHIYTGIFRDVSERRRLEGQLVQTQKMESIGQLAAGIAHEINTPTQYVGDNTRFLEDVFGDLTDVLASCRELLNASRAGAVPGDLVAKLASAAEQADLDYLVEEIPKAINQSLEGVERVATIVRSMKDFSHPGGECKQAVDLNRALESTLTVCRNEWKYVADAVTEFDPQLPLVTCLPGECNQVFLNLIINAAHAIGEKLGGNSTEKGTITIRTSHDRQCVEIRITDTGTGIPEHARSKLFDPFFTTKEVGRGTGQGLAIAHAIVTEKHGGSIRFETKLGQGTTFFVRFPLDGASRDNDGGD